MMLYNHRVNPKQIAIGATLAVIIILAYLRTGSSSHAVPISATAVPKSYDGKVKLSPLHAFWNTTIDLMYKYEPKFTVSAPIHIVDRSESIPGIRTKEALLSRSRINDDVIKELKIKHAGMAANLPKSLPYESGTSGIIFIGGGKFSWLSFVSLQALRDTGSKLPVEIIMPSYADYEEEIEFCNVVLPRLNAACVVIPDVMGPGAMTRQASHSKFQNYQFKSLALMVSSFQNVLLLDSDNIPLANPDSLFESNVYQQHGMVTWPDYWERTTSPIFYDIAGIKVDETKRVRYNAYPISSERRKAPADTFGGEDPENAVPYHDFQGAMANPSTESGQFLINKSTHSRTLLLSMYYNLYGPKLYYKLLSLGEPGEGDKDTFVAAAHVLNEPYYQVQTKVRAEGFHADQFHGVAMMHRDPIQDFAEYQKYIRPSQYKSKPEKEQIELLKQLDDKYFSANNKIPYYFMHCNFPKLDPLVLMDHNVLYDETLNRLKYRMYSDFSYVLETKQNGEVGKKSDFELQQWLNIHETLCIQRTYFRHFKDSDEDKICRFVSNQVTWLKSNKKEIS